MKWLVCLLLTAAAVAPGGAENFNLREHGRLALYGLEKWKITVEDNFDLGCNITIEPRGDANALCKLSVIFPQEDRFDTKEKLRAAVVGIGREEFAESSVERRATAREFYLKHGYGFYCSFTDRDLVGKPPQTRNYKVVSTGIIHLSHDVFAAVTILADDFKGEEYQALLGIVEGMELIPARDIGRI